METWLARGGVGWQAAAIALLAVVGCDDGSSDRHLDAAEDAGLDSGGPAAGNGMQGGAGTRSPMAGRAPEPFDAGDPHDSGDRGMDAGSLPVPMDAGGVPMDAGDPQMDAGDAGATLDAATDSGSDAASEAGGPDAQVEPVDTGVDDDDSGEPEEPGLCVSGSDGCVAVKFAIYADLAVYGGDAAIEVQHGDETLEVVFVAGQAAEVWLPAADPMWIHTRVAGYWDDRVALVIPGGAARFDAGLFVFSSVALSAYYAPFGLSVDESKAFAVVDFFANVPGAGVELGASSDPPVVAGPTGLVQSPTLLSNPGATLVLFTNLQPGNLQPAPVAPPGMSCRLIAEGLEYTAAPKTVLRFWVLCEAVAP